MTTHLPLAPAAQSLEAPASWLSRVALSQGATMKELRSLLPRFKTDLDLVFIDANFQSTLGALGLDVQALWVPSRLLSNFRRASLDPRRFLLFDNNVPRYRYCPGCFRSMRTPHVPIHWRFAAWCYCPEHGCLMNDLCLSCSAPIVLPADMLTAGPDSDGVAYLSDCLRCGKSLAKMPVETLKDRGLEDSVLWSRKLLDNGRAVLAALLSNRVRLAPVGEALPLKALRNLERSGLLPRRLPPAGALSEPPSA